MYSIFYIDVGIYIVSGNPCVMSRSWPAESRWDPWWNRWDPRRDFTQDCGLPQVGSHLGSHPRRSIIPVGIPPGIKTGSRLGSHPRLAGSRVGSHPRRSIIPVGIPPGIPPGIKTRSRVGSHLRRSIIPVGIHLGSRQSHPGSHLGLKRDPGWDWRDPASHFYLGSKRRTQHIP